LKRHRVLLTLCIILILGSFLRVIRIPDRLPYHANPDEYYVVQIYLQIMKSGDLNPHKYIYPGTTIYLNLAAYIPYYLIGRITGEFHSRADVQIPAIQAMGTGYISTPSVFIIGRLFSVILGVASIGLLYLCGKLFSKNSAVGLLAAALLMLSWVNVYQSTLILPNVFLVFFTILTLLFSIKILQTAQRSAYILAGISAGLAIASKYNIIFIVIIILVAHFLNRGWKNWKSLNLLLALAMAGGVFILFNPFIFLDFQSFWNDFQNNLTIYNNGVAGREGNAFAWYLSYLWFFEGPIILFAVIETGIALYRKNNNHLVLTAYAIVYFGFICFFTLRKSIMLMPILPLLYILGGMFIMRLWVWLRTKTSSALSTVTIFALVMIGVAVPTFQTISISIPMFSQNNLETARLWINKNLPVGAKIAIQPYCPFIDPEKYIVILGQGTLPESIAFYANQGVQYVIFSEGSYGRYYTEPDKYSQEIAKYEEIIRQLNLIKAFDQNGLMINIYSTKIDDDG
jgi:4-amino-4-deoxy-L-arabinose transferase-like glycosyltransferase